MFWIFLENLQTMNVFSFFSQIFVVFKLLAREAM